MADSSDIDNAVVALLQADATLMALVPDGVWMDEAPAGKQRFVIVSLVDEGDEAVFGGRAWEDALYLVEARLLSTASGNAKAAAARIDVLLDPQPPAPPRTLTVPGYTHMALFRESRVRLTELDDADPSIRWLRRGGRYRCQMSVGT